MKRLIPVWMMVALFCGFAWSLPAEARLVPVRATHQRVQRHHAHKAGKHHAPKRTHHAV
jgi:hypothetical protein